MASELCLPTIPLSSTESLDQDDGELHDETQVAYLRSSLVKSKYETCIDPLEAIAIEL